MGWGFLAGSVPHSFCTNEERGALLSNKSNVAGASFLPLVRAHEHTRTFREKSRFFLSNKNHTNHITSVTHRPVKNKRKKKDNAQLF